MYKDHPGIELETFYKLEFPHLKSEYKITNPSEFCSLYIDIHSAVQSIPQGDTHTSYTAATTIKTNSVEHSQPVQYLSMETLKQKMCLHFKDLTPEERTHKTYTYTREAYKTTLILRVTYITMP